MIQRQGQQTNTVEGAVSGARAAQLDKERDAQIAAFESAKKELANASSRILPKNVNDKFSKSTRNSAKPNTLGTAQYGLTTLDQYRRAQSGQVDQDKTEKVDDDAIAKAEAKATESRKRAAKKRKASSSFLSFGGGDDDSSSSDDDDDEAEDTTATKDGANAASASSSTSSSASSSASASNKSSKLICKNPDIDTSFLPDRDRRVLEESKRNALKKEYELHQSQLKQQLIEITYSWWDGSGHRRVIQVPQGNKNNNTPQRTLVHHPHGIIALTKYQQRLTLCSFFPSSLPCVFFFVSLHRYNNFTIFRIVSCTID
jgi:protein FAM50